MKNARHILRLMMLIAVMLLADHAEGQIPWSQAEYCPGWNNPTSFTNTQPISGPSTDYKYEGILGYTNSKSPNVKTGETGIDWTGGTVNAGQMASKKITTTGGDCATVKSGTSQNPWVLYSSTTKIGNHPVNTDPMTAEELPLVPVQYNTTDTDQVPTNLTTSIRIGDACGRQYDGINANGLRYYMNVNENNAMLFIYYACVIEAPGHGTANDPAFIIRVNKKDSKGDWIQASPSNPNSNTNNDTLTYMVSSTPKNVGGTVEIGKNGWHMCTVTPDEGSYWGAHTVYWKEWTKVSLNLANLIYEDVMIEVMICDCNYTQHYSYAYISGECRPMSIDVKGCPPGMSTDVAKLTAPRGLNNYVWSVSEYGQASTTDLAPTGEKKHYTFRQLTDDIGTEEDSAYIYYAQADDFRITKKGTSAENTVTIDSVVAMQTFCCTMTSALDPDKPFTSKLYTDVTNTKPSMRIDTLSLCGGDVKLENTSYVPGNEADGVDLASTTWTFYNNPACLGASDSVLTGVSLTAHYTDGQIRGIRVRTNAADDPTCYSEAIYPIRPLPNPEAQMMISKDVLCDDEETTLVDVTPTSTERFWVFRSEEDNNPEPTDTLHQVGDQKSVTRPFTHGVEPIDLIARNGLFYIDPLTGIDTIWCESKVRDSVFVFLHPELQVLGDTIVCNGMLTDATVNAIGVEGCSYEWSTTNGTITGGLPAGNHLAVAPYKDTSTYYVRVTSPQGCVAWDSIHAYLVVPQLQMIPADGRICPGDPVLLKGSHAQSYTWSATPSDTSLAGQEEMQEITVYPRQSTTYTLVGHGGEGENRCDASPITSRVTVFPYPESQVNIDPAILDSENPTVTLRDDSRYSVSSQWVFAGGAMATGREVTHTFEEATGVDSVMVTLTSYNELGCSTVYPFSIPVKLFTAWFPNMFTPESGDENARFRLFSINDYEYFHIYIYNRGGQLVFESNDPAFEWDGTHEGTPQPQGTYVYICRFRKPGIHTVGQVHGSITLVR